MGGQRRAATPQYTPQHTHAQQTRPQPATRWLAPLASHRPHLHQLADDSGDGQQALQGGVVGDVAAAVCRSAEGGAATGAHKSWCSACRQAQAGRVHSATAQKNGSSMQRRQRVAASSTARSPDDGHANWAALLAGHDASRHIFRRWHAEGVAAGGGHKGEAVASTAAPRVAAPAAARAPGVQPSHKQHRQQPAARTATPPPPPHTTSSTVGTGSSNTGSRGDEEVVDHVDYVLPRR